MAAKRFHAGEVMRALISELADNGFGGLGISPTAECEEDWSTKYAVAMFDIVEPCDELRSYLDVDQLALDLSKHIASKFPKTTKSYYYPRDKNYDSKRGLEFHIRPWSVEVIYFENKG